MMFHVKLNTSDCIQSSWFDYKHRITVVKLWGTLRFLTESLYWPSLSLKKQTFFLRKVLSQERRIQASPCNHSKLSRFYMQLWKFTNLPRVKWLVLTSLVWDRNECGYTQQNLVKSNRNQIVFTFFRQIWNQTDVRLVPNQSENGKYNLISVKFNKVSKKIVCVVTAAQKSWLVIISNRCCPVQRSFFVFIGLPSRALNFILRVQSSYW